MEILFALAGVVVGGTLFGAGGALAGAFIGWLCHRVHLLKKRQDAVEREMNFLRQQPARKEEETVTTAKSQTSASDDDPDLIVLTEQDIYVEEQPSPEVRQPVSLEVPPRKDPSPAVPPPPRSHSTPARPPTRIPSLPGVFSTDNLLVKLGVMILFFGVAFLVKYVAQRGLFPLELRLTAAALLGCGLLAAGWRVRATRPVYAQVIEGGGIGILYLTTYAAMNLYHLLPTGAGFLLLIVTCSLAALLALLQDSRPLAVMGSAGGFLAPELAGIGSDGPLLFFGYLAVLNVGILAIARHRNWRELDLLGFVATLVVGTLWGCRFYRPEHLFAVEPFLVIFFLAYTLLPVLHARNQPTASEGYLDCALIFGTPIIASACQAALVRNYEYGMAWSALAAGLFYLSLAGRLFRSRPGRFRNLAEAYLALGTICATLAIPLAAEGRWASAAWSLEGAALVWTGLRRQRTRARVFGYLLLFAAGVLFMTDDGMRGGVWPVLNSSYVGTLLLAGSALVGSRLLARNRELLKEPEVFAEPLLFLWGMFWWYAGGLHEVMDHAASSYAFGACLTFTALSSLGFQLLSHRLDWRLAEWPAFALLPVMGGSALLHLVNGTSYPSTHGGWFGWPLALGIWYLILHRSRERRPDLPQIVHAAPLWLMTLLTTWELSGRMHHHLPGMGTWADCAIGAVVALPVLLIARRGRDLPWPVSGNLPACLGLGAGPLALAAWLWLLGANLFHAGDPWPLPYLPLANPLDGASLLILVALVSWYRALPGTLPELARLLPRHMTTAFLSATVFVWLNGVILRSVHHWGGVPFTPHALFASPTVQATLAIVWTLLALGAMTLAARRRQREIWLAGAGLLGIVVTKLFLVDLAGHSSVARIVSFVVVGLLILLIGWFSPVPPRTAAGRAT